MRLVYLISKTNRINCAPNFDFANIASRKAGFYWNSSQVFSDSWNTRTSERLCRPWALWGSTKDINIKLPQKFTVGFRDKIVPFWWYCAKTGHTYWNWWEDSSWDSPRSQIGPIWYQAIHKYRAVYRQSSSFGKRTVVLILGKHWKEKFTLSDLRWRSV